MSQSKSIFVCVRSARVVTFALALLVVLSGTSLWSNCALGQCTVTTAPAKFQPSTLGGTIPPKFTPGYTFTLDFTGNSRLIVQENYGYGVYDVSSPGAPVPIGYHDMENTIKQSGDGQSLVIGVGGGDDGQRALVGWKQSPYGTFSMRSNGTTFSFAGGYATSRPIGGLTVVQVGNRFFGFSLAQGGLYAADITNVPSGGLTTANSIPTEIISGATVNSLIKGLVHAGRFIAYSAGTKIVLVDVGSPGPGVTGFTSGYTVYSFGPTAFGLPSGSTFTSVAAAMHPNGKLYIAAESTVTGASSGIGLASTSVSSINLTPVGSAFVPPNSSPTGTATMVATSDDVLALFWEIVGSDSKLVTLSANGWGTDLSSNIVVASGQLGNLSTPSMVRAKFQGGAIYQYVAASFGSFVLGMTCTGANSPPSIGMNVGVDNGSGTYTNVPEGGRVYVGDRLRIQPTVSPSPSSVPLNSWRFDYDFHPSEDLGSGAYPRISLPDLSAGSAPPSQIALVGPCDPNVSGTDASTGSGCWNSVTTNTATGGPDFSSGAPAGAEKLLRLGLEAQNAYGAALKTFNLTWTVPAAKLKSTAVLLGGTLEDASEGHPKTTGYKWYFGSTPGAPGGETLTQDTNCSGKTCAHAFASKGTYNYWVTVPYEAGFSTPDCGSPCTQSKGALSVTDVVVAVTAPTSALKSGAISLTNQSTVAQSVTPCGTTGYQYDLCDASAGSCGAGAYQDLSWSGSSASIPAPSNAGSYWLRVRYRYSTTGSGGCASPLIADWTPNTQNDPTAWPIGVLDVVPEVRLFVNGIDPCAAGPGGFGCSGGYTVYVNDNLAAYSYVGGSVDQNPPGITWQFGRGSTPTSGSGQGATFRYTSSGSSTVTMNGYGSPVSVNVTVQNTTTGGGGTGGGGGGGGTTPLSVSSVAASPNPAVVNVSSVRFTLVVSGGAGGNTYTWTFGDGGSSGGTSPTHVYTSTGQYTATVTVRDATNATATGSVLVTVQNDNTVPPPTTLDFSVVDSATSIPVFFSSGTYYAASGQALSFVSAGTSGTVNWNFGDNGTASGATVSHTYVTSTTKTYTAVMTAGNGTKSYKVSVTGGAGAPITGAYTYRYADNTAVVPTNVTSGKAIRFTAADTADTYDWDFGDSTTHGTTAQVDHSYGAAGTYIVKLTVTKSGQNPATTASPVSFTVPRPPEPPQWVLAGMAYTNGAGTAVWQSDFSIFNPSSTRGMKVSFAYLAGGNDYVTPANLVWYEVTLAKLETKIFRNVLGSFPLNLAKGAFGALLIRGDDLPSEGPVITGRTYNTGSGAGTYGLSVPAVPVSGGVRAQAAAASNILVGLKERPGSYRTNLAIANLKTDYAKAEIRFYDANNQQLGTVVSVDLNPLGVTQLNRVLATAAGYTDPTDTFVAEVKVVSGTAVFPYASVIDERSGDPVVITPSAKPSATYRLPGVVHTRGKNNTLFQTDVVLYNPSATARDVYLRYWYQAFRDGQSSGVTSQIRQVRMQPKQVLAFEDFVKVWLPAGSDFANTDYANSYVDIGPAAGDPNTDALLVLGQTYNAGGANGNSGFQVPGYINDDGASATGTSKRLTMTGLAANSAYRTNVAVFLTKPELDKSATAAVNVVDSTGAVVKTMTITLNDVSAITQLNSDVLFGGLTGDTGNLTVVIDNVNGNSPIAAYASVVDNTSGDAILIPGQPIP